MTDLLTEEMVEAALNAASDELPESVQYALIRGLSAMGWEHPNVGSWDVMRAALSAVLPLIVEACAKVAKDVITKARMGEIDQDLRSIGHNIDYALREAASPAPQVRE